MQKFFIKYQSFPLPTDCFRNTFFFEPQPRACQSKAAIIIHALLHGNLTSFVILFLEQNGCYVYVLLNMN